MSHKNVHHEPLFSTIFNNARDIPIAGLDFASYEVKLRACYLEAVKRLKVTSARALYFEYDLDNLWDGNLFLCQEYNSEPVGDEDWACDWVDEVSGPRFEHASDLYLENDFDRSEKAKGSTLYLVARTVAAFGHCFDANPVAADAVCIAFHDQEPITRIHEAAQQADEPDSAKGNQG